MRLVYSILVTLLLFSPSFSFAETKEIISEGTYNMGDGETPSVAESRALLKAKQIAVEQAGTYVESYSKVKNITLTQDEIQVLASGLMEVEILDKKRTVVGDGINFWVKIKAKVNTDTMEEMAKRVKEKSAVEDFKMIQEAYEKSQREIEDLKKQLAAAKNPEEKKKIESKVAVDERNFQAAEWFEKGKASSDKAFLLKSAKKLDPKFVADSQAEYKNAITAFSKAIEKNHEFADAYARRGRAYANIGQFDKALNDLNKTIALQPDNGRFYVIRGGIYRDNKQYDKALNDYNKAIALQPDNSSRYIVRGLFYEDKKQYDKAMSDYTKAVTLSPDDPSGYNWRKEIYKAKGQLNKAIEDLSKVIELTESPRLKALYYGERASLYRENGEDNLSFDDLNAALSLDSRLSADTYAERGKYFYFNKEDDDSAINDFTTALELEPGYSEYLGVAFGIYLFRGDAYIRTKKYALALEDFNRIINSRIDSNRAEAYKGRGDTYYFMSQYPNAVLDYGKALSLKKDYAEAHVMRGASYLRMNMKKSALSDFKKACKLGEERGCLSANMIMENRD